MIIIPSEDADKIVEQLRPVIKGLGAGQKRVDLDISFGEDYSPVKASGYWIGDVLRIDIKIKQGG